MTVTFNNVADYAYCLLVIGIMMAKQMQYVSLSTKILCFTECAYLAERLAVILSRHFVQLDVIEVFSESSVASKAGQFSSELMKRNTDYSHHGYRVSFDKNIILKKNKMYDIRAKISGPSSLCGVHGLSCVQCSGVTFTFVNS